MPSLERLRRKFSSEQLQILAVTTDIRPREIESFWKQLDLHFEVVLHSHITTNNLLIYNNPADKGGPFGQLLILK